MQNTIPRFIMNFNHLKWLNIITINITKPLPKLLRQRT